ncbi:MFS transporter [Nocardioides insulae]|uniref:MFS transporter n=1 Tax=Nocardioides insulae TaxID=394734 RepID=UPI0004130DF4|nr:MFS transporter [Nocardioides insulae]
MSLGEGEAALRPARRAVSALFFVNAVLYANLIPRLPEIKDQLGLSNAGLGTAIAAMPFGALAAGLLAPLLIQRFGSGRVGALGLVLLAFAVAGVPFAGSWLGLAAVMLVVGSLDAVVDVAQNAHALRLQRRYDRSIINSFHGMWSLGAVTGGLLGSAAAGLIVPLGLHLLISAVVFSVVALVAGRWLLPGPDGQARAQRTTTPVRRPTGRVVLLVLALGVLASCGVFVEDAGATWSALYLRVEVGATAALGGLAFVALQAAMTVGRFTGDRAVDRYGAPRVALVGGAAIALGMGLALTVPSVPTTLVGFTLAGLGTATVIPLAMHTADELPGLAPGVGLTAVNWLLRVGLLLSPVAVGLVADASNLRVALLSVVIAGVGVMLLGRLLGPRQPSPVPAPSSVRQCDG